MTKKKSTKRALISSLLILAMCFTMLAGTTFAWFTDSVTSTGNKILSGKLDISLYLADTQGTYNEITAQTAPIFGNENSLVAQNDPTDTLWEPGKTQIAYLKLKNDGNLWLKYSVAINVSAPNNSTLYEVMQYAIVPNAVAPNGVASGSGLTYQNVVLGNQTTATDVSMAPGAEHYFALAVHMDEAAGNAYQEGEVDFDMTVLATQLNQEEDSFGPDYDKFATYPDAVTVNSAAAFTAAIADPANDGKTIDAQGTTVDAIINGNVTNELTIANAVFSNAAARNVNNNGNTTSVFNRSTFDEHVTFENCTFEADDTILSNTFKEGVTFDNCTIKGEDWSAIYNNTVNGDVVIKNCTIEAYAYAVNFGGGDGDNTLYIENCDIKGWNSFGDTSFNKVIIKNTKFGKSDGYGVVRFYQDAEIKDCEFSSDFVYIDSNKTGITIKIDNCTGLDYDTQLYSNVPSSGAQANVPQVANWIIDGNPYDCTLTH